MERWTLKELIADRFRLHIQHGGRPFWCTFDFTATPTKTSDEVEIALVDDADQASENWFPDLKRGMEAVLMEAEQRGRMLVGVKIAVQKIHTHDVATTALGCEYYGRQFADCLVWRWAIPTAERARAERTAAPETGRADS